DGALGRGRVLDVGVVAVTVPWMAAVPPKPRPKPPPPGTPLARGPPNWPPFVPRLDAAVDAGVVKRPTANARPPTATRAARPGRLVRMGVPRRGRADGAA